MTQPKAPAVGTTVVSFARLEGKERGIKRSGHSSVRISYNSIQFFTAARRINAIDELL